MLIELHWLPVEARCEYKVAVLAYKHFDGTLAPYLSAVLTSRIPNRTLRSSTENNLTVPEKPNLKSAGERAFRYNTPVVWNSLPITLRHLPTLAQFKAHLKTYLFRKYLL